MREEFEKWFLSLNEDFDQENLHYTTINGYFYTTTQALYDQFVEIAELKAHMEELKT